MKQLIILPFIFVTALVFGQTNVIALKSHAGELDNLTKEKDNFGLPNEVIDTFYYVGNDCVLQVSHYFEDHYNRTTICDHYLFIENKFELDKIRPMYNDNVVFIGFEKHDGNDEKPKKSRRSKGALPFMIVFVLAAGYFFRKQTKISVD